jgi:ribonuclease R
MAAERDSTDRYVAAFMEDRIGQTFDARVTGVTRFGLFVRLAESGAEGLIPIRSLGADYFHHDEKRQALIGQRSHVVYGMGAVLAVKLQEAAPITGGLRFSLADGSPEPARQGGKPRTGKPKRSGKDRFRGKKR